jgi:hypothetical protein
MNRHQEDAMTVSEPAGQPDLERPPDLTDVPGRDNRPQPAPTPEHHPGGGLAGDHPDPLAADPPRG